MRSANWKIIFCVALVSLGPGGAELRSAEAQVLRRLARPGLSLFRRPFFNRRFRSVNRGFGASAFHRRLQHRGRNRHARVSRFRHFVDAKKLTRVTGFSRLARTGHGLAEIDRFGRASRLFIDRFGRLVGARELETITHLREFLLKNFERFRGRDRNTAERFLVAHADNSGYLGLLNVAVRDRPGLSVGVVPDAEGYRNYSPEQIRTAALAFIVNSVSESCDRFPVSTGDIDAGGNIPLNLNSHLRNNRLALLLNANPYSCGDPNAPARVDYLATRAFHPETYPTMVGRGKNLREVGAQFGVAIDQTDLADSNNRKITRTLIKGDRENPVTAVGVNPQRVLERQTRLVGGRIRSFYRSYDFIEHPDTWVETGSRDVLKEGINFTSDASEYIYQKCNAFMGFILTDNVNDAGTCARSAPADVAIRGGKAVTSGDSCLMCHSNGFWGGGKSLMGKGDWYKDYYGEISRLGSYHQQFFSPMAQYYAEKQADSREFMRVKKATGAHLQDPTYERPDDVPDAPTDWSLPVVFDMAQAYRKPVTLNQLAAELGTSNIPAVQTLVRANLTKTGLVDRENVERNFCRWKQQLGLGSFPSGVPGSPLSGPHDDDFI